MKHVLFVTGATGVIGRPLVEALCAREDVAHVFALTHDSSLDLEDRRLAVLAGDVTAGPSLGLDASTAGKVAAEISGIVHLAADTRFGTPIDVARRTNVEGTANVLAFAECCPRLDCILCLSTVHVAGKRTGAIRESELCHTAGFVNAYESSKYEAEQLVRRRMLDLPIAVCRLSTVIGDSRTGVISKLGAIHHAVRLMYSSLVPMVPGQDDSPIDLIALDYALAGVMTLALCEFVPGCTWHLCAGRDTLTTGELLDLSVQTFTECRPGWRTRAIERPLLVDLATFELFHRSLNEIGDSALRASTAIVANFAPQLAFPKWFDDSECEAALAKHAIERPHARDSLIRVVRYLIESNWGRRAQQAKAVET